MKKAQIILAGCPRRTIELERVKGFLRGNGYSIVGNDYAVSKEAELIIYSTCAFTTATEDLGIETLDRIQREKNSSAKLVVCGCLPAINPDRLSQVFDGETFGPRSYERLNEILRPEKELQEFPRANTFQMNRSIWTMLVGRTLCNIYVTAKTLVDSRDLSLQGLKGMIEKIRQLRMWEEYYRTTGYGQDNQFYIQIQEGCPSKCSYCAIPSAIGELKSRPIDDVIHDFLSGLELGYESFHLMGDSIATYGLDIGTNLGHLLETVLQLDGDFTLDLGEVSAIFLGKCFSQIKAFCDRNRMPSLWVPIQSANPRILKLMRRSCDVDDVRDKLLELKSGDRVKLGTSIIAGFPSETREELKDTIEFCRRVGFDFLICHGFSARPETDAAKLPNQLSPGEILERRRLVRSALHKKTLIILQ
jgi:tRNA A37 methylthiotransferase MiaB